MEKSFEREWRKTSLSRLVTELDIIVTFLFVAQRCRRDKTQTGMVNPVVPLRAHRHPRMATDLREREREYKSYKKENMPAIPYGRSPNKTNTNDPDLNPTVWGVFSILSCLLISLFKLSKWYDKRKSLIAVDCVCAKKKHGVIINLLDLLAVDWAT